MRLFQRGYNRKEVTEESDRQMVGGANFTTGFDVDEFASVASFGLMDEIVWYKNYFKLMW